MQQQYQEHRTRFLRRALIQRMHTIMLGLIASIHAPPTLPIQHNMLSAHFTPAPSACILTPHNLIFVTLFLRNPKQIAAQGPLLTGLTHLNNTDNIQTLAS
ncbi:hypothetical protein AOT81_05890 [Xylella fastidiosa]|nr:hypothetical protein AOT81_05890 [Xylella fastidiosa]RWA44813.1 hypothetical protein XfCFBP8356_03985 [Xylella fastidiosa subsp. sandyi]